MKKGGFMKDALILFAITLISGICLGGVYEITKLPIQESKMKADLATYQEMCIRDRSIHSNHCRVSQKAGKGRLHSQNCG